MHGTGHPNGERGLEEQEGGDEAKADHAPEHVGRHGGRAKEEVEVPENTTVRGHERVEQACNKKNKVGHF